jgi:hypothetical protein
LTLNVTRKERCFNDIVGLENVDFEVSKTDMFKTLCNENFRQQIAQAQKLVPSVVYTISTSERKRREKAFVAARASVELEGFSLSKDYLAQMQRFIDGEIELSDVIGFIDEQARKR